jgi:hypothetical protein
MGASIAFAADRTMFGGFIRLDDRALGLKGTGITHAPQPVYWVLPTRRTLHFRDRLLQLSIVIGT